jgi:multifunctional 2-oxoglutarate metabolism enzyme
VHLTPAMPVPFSRVSRPESASPAVGQASRHKEEQKALLQQAFG